MAKTNIVKSNQNCTSVLLLGLFLLFLSCQGVAAREFKINWKVPTDSNNASTYDQWAERNRFQVNDSLVFDYPAGKDSVLRVEKDPYDNCNTGSYLESHSDGHTVFTFNRSGPYYFISGVADNCRKNQKLHVIVLAVRSNNTAPSTSPPASPPAESPTGQTPASAPSGESSPSPPPGASLLNPSPAPEQSTPPPPNAASSILMSFSSSFGALLGSSLLLASLT